MGAKKVTERITEKKFKSSIKEIGEVLSGKKPSSEKTKIASKTISKYTRQIEKEVKERKMEFVQFEKKLHKLLEQRKIIEATKLNAKMFKKLISEIEKGR